jgi:hypothetical protein
LSFSTPHQFESGVKLAGRHKKLYSYFLPNSMATAYTETVEWMSRVKKEEDCEVHPKGGEI